MRTPRAESTLSHEAADDLHSRRALVVDDCAAVAEAVRDQLVSWGIDCECATSARDALDALRDRARRRMRFDVVMLDARLGDADGIELAASISRDAAARAPIIIATYDLGHVPDEARMRGAGIRAWLPKPIRQSQLLNCLVDVLTSGRTWTPPAAPARSAPSAAEGSRTPPRPEVAGKVRKRARILLAEDHALNQRVVLKTLERLGFRADAVSTGREAVEAVARQGYDLVLMDCQMPEMDGYEATRAIRKLGGPRGRVPIVGVTAHALEGDREKCLAAGMDDYVSKPLLPGDLTRILEKRLALSSERRLASRAGAAVENESRPAAEPDEPPIDVAALKALADADTRNPDGFVSQLIDLYLADLDDRVRRMRADLKGRNLKAVSLTAHALKGSSAHFGARRLVKLLAQVEANARREQPAEVAAALDAATRETAAVRRALEASRAGVGGGTRSA
jgi:CheY-like chemotaxis protein/HPt (histidine-containing phosphotransfer) domain-containing protein